MMSLYVPLVVLIVLCDVSWKSMADSGTVHPAEILDLEDEVKYLKDAIYSPANRVIDRITRLSFNQRLSLADQWKKDLKKGYTLRYGLKQLVESEDKNAGHALHYMFGRLTTNYAHEVHDAISIDGTDENALIEVLVPLDYSGMRDVTLYYHYNKYFRLTLTQDIEDDTSGDFRTILLALCEANRNDRPNATDDALATKDVDRLVTIGAGEWSSNGILNTLLAKTSFSRLRKIFDEFGRRTGRTIEAVIEAEFEYWAKETYLAIVQYARDKYTYFATRLNVAMVGSNAATLTRIVVGRSETDLGDIKQAYLRKYGHELIVDIEAHTTGYFQRILKNLIGK